MSRSARFTLSLYMRTALALPLGPLTPQPEPISLSLETLRESCGAYRSPEGAAFKVSLDEAGRAVVSIAGLTEPADPIAEDAIAFSTADGGKQTIRCFRLGGDEISHAFTGGRLVKRREISGG